MTEHLPTRKRLRRLLFGYDWEIVELQGALLMSGWGLWLLIPFQTFGIGATNAYSGLSEIAPEIFWGAGMLIFGATQFYALYKGNNRLRRLLIFIACLFWLYLTITVGLVRPSAGLIPFTFITAFFLAVNYIRLGVRIVVTGRNIDE